MQKEGLGLMCNYLFRVFVCKGRRFRVDATGRRFRVDV
jgi:hypothetical protein